MIWFHTGSECRKCCLTLFTAWISKIRLVSFALTSPRTECELLNEGNSFQTHTQKAMGRKSSRLPGGQIIAEFISVGHPLCGIFLCTMTWLYVFIYIFWRVHRMLPWGMLQLSGIPFYIYITNNSAYILTRCCLTICNYGGAVNSLSQVLILLDYCYVFLLFYLLFIFHFFEFCMSNAFGTQTNLEAGKSCSLRLYRALLALGKICREDHFHISSQVRGQILTQLQGQGEPGCQVSPSQVFEHFW